MASVNEYSTRYSEAIDAQQTTPPDAWGVATDHKQGFGWRSRDPPRCEETLTLLAFALGPLIAQGDESAPTPPAETQVAAPADAAATAPAPIDPEATAQAAAEAAAAEADASTDDRAACQSKQRQLRRAADKPKATKKARHKTHRAPTAKWWVRLR